jgi:molybdopterin-guanine dinucleotide biosynthesis protein A
MISAIILAGGNSTRMGSDKASLNFLGERFIDRIVSVVSEFYDDIIVVGDRKYDHLANCRQVPDMVKDSGPLAGLCSGLHHSSTERNLVLSCDVPLVTRDILNLLLERDRDEYDVVLPEVNGRLMPLVAFYKQRALLSLEDEVSAGRLKLTDAVMKLNVCKVALQDVMHQQITNINTKESYNLLVQ